MVWFVPFVITSAKVLRNDDAANKSTTIISNVCNLADRIRCYTIQCEIYSDSNQQVVDVSLCLLQYRNWQCIGLRVYRDGIDHTKSWLLYDSRHSIDIIRDGVGRTMHWIGHWGAVHKAVQSGRSGSIFVDGHGRWSGLLCETDLWDYGIR